MQGPKRAERKFQGMTQNGSLDLGSRTVVLTQCHAWSGELCLHSQLLLHGVKGFELLLTSVVKEDTVCLFNRRFGLFFVPESCFPSPTPSQRFNLFLYNFLEKINLTGFLIEMSKQRLNCSCLIHQNYFFLFSYFFFLWYKIK